MSLRVQPRRNPIVQEYVLPDLSIRMKGYIRSGPNAQPQIPSEPPSSGSSHMDLDGTKPQPSTLRENGSEPVLYMGNERFTVPEVLFHPRDVGEPDISRQTNSFPFTNSRTGLNQTGLPQTIATCISSLEVPDDIRGLFWANIGLMGGNFCMEGIVPRLCVCSTHLVAILYDF